MSPSLLGAVQSVIDSGRIGSPVAVRVIDQGVPPRESLIARMARVLTVSCTWLREEIQLLAAVGGAEAGQISVLARGRKGATLLAAVGYATEAKPLFALSLIGNHGVLNWLPDDADTPSLVDFGESAASPSSMIQLGETVAAALEQGEAVLAATNRPPPGSPIPAQLAKPLPRPQAFCPPALLDGRPWGVLLIGGGQTHQENYAAALAADKRCRLVGLSDQSHVGPRRKALNEQLAREWNIPVFPDLAEALRRPDVHLVSVCAEPERRGQLIVQAAAAGKHLYLDKPLAATVEEAQAIAQAVQQAGVQSHCFNLTHSASGQQVRSWVSSGTLGDLRAVHCDLLFAKGQAGGASLAASRQETARPTSFESIEAKREFYNVGVYPTSLLRCLWPGKPKRLFAATGNYFFAEHERENMEDFGAALIEYEGGRAATIMAGRTGWKSHPLSGLNRTCLVGVRGARSIDAFRPRLEVWSDAAPWPLPARHAEDPMGFWSSTQAQAQVRPKLDWVLPFDQGPTDAKYFLDCLEQGRASELNAAAAADVLQMLLAVYESAAGGRFVAV